MARARKSCSQWAIPVGYENADGYVKNRAPFLRRIVLTSGNRTS